MSIRMITGEDREEIWVKTNPTKPDYIKVVITENCVTIIEPRITRSIKIPFELPLVTNEG